MYYFTKGNLKTANKQFSAVKNDYEITFTNDTSIIPCEDAQHLPSVQFDFVSIGDLENVNKDSIVGEWQTEHLKWGEETKYLSWHY